MTNTYCAKCGEKTDTGFRCPNGCAVGINVAPEWCPSCKQLRKENEELRARCSFFASANEVQAERAEKAEAALNRLRKDYDLNNCRANKLEAENKRLRDRDGKATIELCYDDGVYPFNRLTLDIVDFGVSDNTYIVNCKEFEQAEAENKRLKEVMEHCALSAGVMGYTAIENSLRFALKQAIEGERP